MSTATINYSNFQLDWWDAAGATAEAVKTGIENAIKEAFGTTSVPEIQQQAIVNAATQHYQAQEAMKAAAKAAQEAAKYADLPSSPLYLNAMATVKTYENIASSAMSQANQIMQNAKVDTVMVGNLSRVVNVLGPAINAAQLGVSAASGDAYEVGKTAVSVLAGMAIGSLAIATMTFLGLPVIGAAAIGIATGFYASAWWKDFWDNGAADFYGIKPGDEFSFSRLSDAISDLFTAAIQAVLPKSDPLVLDLDNDGLETTGLNAANPIYFDQNADGVKTATGWVGTDDAFLVLDKNANGTIDNGRELFGDAYIKSNGQLATDGFDALRDLDANADGKINAGSTAHSQILANGNQLADLGSYVKTDGSVATLGEVTGNLADINLAQDTFHSQFTDHLNTTAVAALPDMQGAGQVRSLREAATLSPVLAQRLTDFAATTRAAQQALIDPILKAWSDTSIMPTTFTGAYAGHTLTVNGLPAAGTAERQAWENKISLLERFNGRIFNAVPAGTAANDTSWRIAV